MISEVVRDWKGMAVMASHMHTGESYIKWWFLKKLMMKTEMF